MKTIFNKQKRSVAGVLIALTALTTALTGCQEDFELDLPLAVSARELSLTKDAGSTHVLVYSNGDWTARFTRPVKWASLNKLQGYGNNEIVFTYSANYGISRKIGVVFEKGSLTDTVMFSQAGAITDASLSFSKPAVTLLKSRSQIFTPISTNLRYCIDDLEASVTYYDNDGLPNDPVTVLTRAEEGEEGGEGEGGDEPQAQPVEPWISNVSATYKGITFEVTDNDSGFARIADLTLFIEDAKGEITKSVLTVTQGIALPALKLDSNAETYEGYAQDCAVPATTNNLVPYSDQIGYDVAYDVPVAEGAEWILKPAITDDGLTFSLAKNEGSEPRTATIRLNFTDEHGNSVSASCKITQKPYPTAADFAAVRALTPGEITLQQYIEGYIVSDPDSKNVVSSPQTKQFFFDRGENDRTAYIESLDGKWGFCLKFASSEDNTPARFSKVRLSLNGATLEKKNSPECYTITGLTAANILETSTPDEFKIPVKTKTIGELTDDDIFTLVSVTNLEIMCKDGAYTNCTDGYSFKDNINPIGTATAPRWDVAPLMCYDNTGRTIYMLTNTAAPWRRFSSGRDLDFNSVVPQGSGTFRGIVVADDVAPIRFGDLGRYQLRAMTAEEIALTDEPFSKTVVEWNWNDRKTDLIPEIGEGEINKYGATQGAAADFNNVVCSGKGGASSEQKGLVANGGITFTQQWWDFDADTGKYFDISFSTQGISGSNMVFGIVWGHGSMSNTTLSGPAHWNLLYSVDGGTTFQAVPDSPIIKKRSITWWSTTSQDSTPGFTEHLRKLPADCFGREKVVLRLQVADKVTDIDPKATSSNYLTALGIEKGTLTPSVAAGNSQARIGTITVRYN